MIYIPGKKIWIDKYEVSWGQLRRFLETGEIQMPARKSSKYIKDGDEFPAVVTHEEAVTYCRHYGLRLPRSDEWEFAAGKQTSVYPWGDREPGADGIWPANIDSLEGKEEKDGFNGTAPVKSYEQFSSPFGVVNMAGNVWEWVQGKTLKGGGFFSTKKDLRINESVGSRENDREGFRCVKSESEGA